ncbi:hypothetical protein AMTR_s00095p00029930 [Amborella trichopoda]|uniref:Uncharacterized protein n=1 Tax=Amborella trichopoda TaxID=13333 RepID=W1NT35_AMBTC|nr:hypothetical protein AMTR_s00095p00029930 [Amborella trichopoda]
MIWQAKGQDRNFESHHQMSSDKSMPVVEDNHCNGFEKMTMVADGNESNQWTVQCDDRNGLEGWFIWKEEDDGSEQKFVRLKVAKHIEEMKRVLSYHMAAV